MKSSGYVLINGLALDIMIQERGVDKKQLAKSVGVTVETLNNWINGAYKAQRPRFDKLCHVLQIAPKVLSSTSAEIVEYGSTKRILRFHMREAAGINNDPTYREIREIREDLDATTERNIAEDETREENLAILGSVKPHSSSKPDNPGGDEVSE